jgi:hypothetical protein
LIVTEGDGLLRSLRQGLVGVGFLRKGGVEVDPKNLLNPDEGGDKDWAWDGPVGGDDGMRLECGTPFGFGSDFSFGGWFRQCAAPAISKCKPRQ